MAIRFVDFGRQLDPAGPRRFGFWDEESGTHHGGFLVFDFREAWASWEEFERCSSGRVYGPPINLGDIKSLCEPWVFGKEVG